MTDRYVIVYRDGSMSEPHEKSISDHKLKVLKAPVAWPVRRPAPAYRIRIREKAREHSTTQYGDPNHWLVKYGEACLKAWTADAV